MANYVRVQARQSVEVWQPRWRRDLYRLPWRLMLWAAIVAGVVAVMAGHRPLGPVDIAAGATLVAASVWSDRGVRHRRLGS